MNFIFLSIDKNVVNNTNIQINQQYFHLYELIYIFRLLAHACPICEDSPTYKTFRQVDNHLRTEHHFSYCDLCVSDLKVKCFFKATNPNFW